MIVLSPIFSFIRCRAGAIAIEAAFILPIFFAFCLGVAEFGRLYWVRDSLQYSVDQVGRYALAHEDVTASTLQTLAVQNFGSVSTGPLNVSVCGDTHDGDNYVTILATYQFKFLTGLVPLTPITLQGKSRVPLLSRDTQVSPACS